MCAPCFLQEFESYDTGSDGAYHGSDGADDTLTDGADSDDAAKVAEDSPDFIPEQGNPALDAVTKAVYRALQTSGQTPHVRVEPGVKGTSPTLIAAEMQNGPRFSSRCYDAVHVARKALEEITASLQNVALLSKRVQKEDRGYSLRSSIACIPKGAEDRICWDLFHKGHCPRRKNCHWYHPQESDIFRVKVSVRCTEETNGVAPEDQLPASASVPLKRHTISLGMLV